MRRLWRIVCVSLLFLLLLTSSAAAYISENYEDPDTGYCEIISDTAGLLKEKSGVVSEIREQMYLIREYGHAALLTVDSEVSSTTEFTKEIYRDWFGKESGVLFVIDMYNRQLYIFSDGAIYKTITRSTALTITDNVYRYAQDGDYSTCVLETFRQIATKLEGGKIAQPMRYLSAFFLSMLVGLMLTFILAKYTTSTSLSEEKEFLSGIRVEQDLKNAKRLLVRRSVSKASSSDGGGGDGGGGGGGGSSGGGGGHGF